LTPPGALTVLTDATLAARQQPQHLLPNKVCDETATQTLALIKSDADRIFARRSSLRVKFTVRRKAKNRRRRSFYFGFRICDFGFSLNLIVLFMCDFL
jgi:hypothetical protein